MSTNFKSFATVKLSKLKKILATWESIKTPDENGEIEVTMEYLIGSCFPDLWRRFQDNIRDQYTKGYIAGVKDTEVLYQKDPELHVMVKDNENNS